jgi:7-cyano-7-deazaguanine synthase
MSGTKTKSVALLSGGLDSVVATAVAAGKSGGVALALTFDYGQRSAKREAKAARAVARELGIEWKLVRLPWLAELLPTAIRKGAGALPRPAAADLDSASRARETARAVWVPNRNGVFVNVAAAFAESLGVRDVVAGFNREEAATFPDNSPEFIKRATGALALSTANHVRVISPTARLDKAGIVRLGVRTGAPLAHVWSCYDAGARMCGSCESCARLVRALDLAKAPDDFRPRALPVRRGSST